MKFNFSERFTCVTNIDEVKWSDSNSRLSAMCNFMMIYDDYNTCYTAIVLRRPRTWNGVPTLNFSPKLIDFQLFFPGDGHFQPINIPPSNAMVCRRIGGFSHFNKYIISRALYIFIPILANFPNSSWALFLLTERVFEK